MATNAQSDRKRYSKEVLLKSFSMIDAVPQVMHDEMHEIQPLMHLLSTYVIKPIAFDPNPYVLPRAAQFVKYGGANKYFQRHGGKPGPDGLPVQEKAEGQGEFRRPYTQQAAERKNSGAGEVVDDFETVGDQKKVKPRVPYKKPSKYGDNPDEQAVLQRGEAPRKNSDVGQTAPRKTSDVGQAPRKTSDVAQAARKTSDVGQKPAQSKPADSIEAKPQSSAARPQTASAKPQAAAKAKKPVEAPVKKAEKPVAKPVAAAKPVEEPKVAEVAKPAEENKDGPLKLKGPRPRGKAKFKPVAQEEAKIEESELSENQKRKIEERKRKKEAEEKAKRELEEKQRQEKLRLQREKEERETEERRIKTEMMFKGLAEANEMRQNQEKKAATSFEDVMKEQAKQSRKEKEVQKRIQEVRESKQTGMKFDWIGAQDKAYAKDSMAAVVEQQETQAVSAAAAAAQKNQGGKRQRKKK